MEHQRPDPESLLKTASDEAANEGRGKLKVFFGASPGVGKTYAMLETARRLRDQGIDIVVGVVETHGRAETEALLGGLEVLPRRETIYRGITLREFDLLAALGRRPAVVVVDELAHTNTPDSWHAKRWQDVEELLRAGIDVLTTVNVQHLESVNDLVAKITGVVVRETVPDAIFDNAADVELVDLTSDDLLQRMRDGKVYIPSQASRAMDSFFAKGNLIALRELALRRMADRVETQMEQYRRAQGSAQPALAADRFVVAVSPSPFAQRVVRAARRQANRQRAEWDVVYVEVPGAAPLSAQDRERVFQTLRLAEQLGARAVTLTGDDAVAEIIRYATLRRAGRIMVGKPGRRTLRDRLTGSFVDDLIQNEAGIDVHVVRGTAEEIVRHRTRPTSPSVSRSPYLAALAVMAVCTAIGWPVAKYFHETSTAMLYVLGTVVVALAWGRGPAFAASVVGVLCYDFFFIPPHFTFAVGDVRYVFTFAVILIVGNVIANLALQVKRQADSARRHERRTRALYELTRDLAATRTAGEAVEATRRAVAAIVGCETAVILRGADAEPVVSGEHASPVAEWPMDLARWVLDRGQVAGLGTDTFPSSDALLMPMNGTTECVGALALRPPDAAFARDTERMLLLDALARIAAGALEQRRLLKETQDARMQVESERLQSALLASVSHDLRTPLATITAAAAGLADGVGGGDEARRRHLADLIRQEAERLERLVGNLLQMTRLESGAVRPNLDWQSVEELVGAAIRRMDRELVGRTVEVEVAPDVPLVKADALLIEQVLLNLLDNAAKHTPPATPIEVALRRDGDAAVVSIADRGPGLPAGSEERVFEKFFRSTMSGGAPGAGLGLAIVRGFVAAHGGSVTARNRPGGGAVFEVRLPVGAADAVGEVESHREAQS
ncbi:MAG: sensor histidine kinase KdpD [Deltaproteobacteria bacterium]|nr:sensor histidine kinase KdpD [Deltaproteobacteria bacterium]